MEAMNHSVLSIAGFDPCGGAGVLADAKTFEANKVRGMAVVTAITIQNDIAFKKVNWLELEAILEQYNVLQERFDFAAIKIGLVENLPVLQAIVTHVKSYHAAAYIIWDPILSASAGFQFHQAFDQQSLQAVLKDITLITPNAVEARLLTGLEDEHEAAKVLAKHCNVLLKGGHSSSAIGTDYLLMENKTEVISPFGFNVQPKHGSGCVLSAAIAARLTRGEDLSVACQKAKKYTEKFLSSTTTLLGTHDV